MTSSSSVSKHKDKKYKKKRNKKEKKSSSKSVPTKETNLNDGSGSESTDLAGELHSIGYYINDREEMINQMFSIIKPDKIRAMLPPILKDSSMQELKAYCLEELLGMSAKRINSVLEGRELETSSESDDGSPYPENVNDTSMSPAELKSYWYGDETRMVMNESDVDKVVNNAQEINGVTNDMDTLEIGITHEEMGELLNYVPPGKKRYLDSPEPCSSTKQSKLKHRKLKDPQCSKKVVKKNTESEISGNIQPEEKEDLEKDANQEESKGKTLLEILELEMRARAIRALLKQQVGAGDGEDMEISTEDQGDIIQESDVNILTNVENCTKSISNDDSSNRYPESRKKVKLNNDSDNVEPIIKKLKQKSSHNFTDKQCVNTVHSKIDSPLDTDCASQQNKSIDSKDNKLNKKSSMQDNFCEIIKAEVLSNDEDTVAEIEPDTKELKLSAVKGTEINEGTVIHEPDREDGELSSDIEKSCHSVLEIQPGIDSSDIIVLDDSEDEDFQNNSNSEKIQDKQVGISNLETENERMKLSDKADNKCLDKERLISCNQENCGNGTNTSEGSSVNPNCQPDSDSIQPLLVKELSKENYIIVTDELTEIKEDISPDELMKRCDSADVSWASRWLQSKGVQQVVSTSKMCAKIRKRMKSAKKEKGSTDSLQPDVSRKSSLVIVGSVNEYNMLDKPKGSEDNCIEKEDNISADT
ncbi:hypothetical protein C0J52_10760 [Blattella germanica]|nr:hypothetical protein C0J52_10760 [Blattella germanica]